MWIKLKWNFKSKEYTISSPSLYWLKKNPTICIQGWTFYLQACSSTPAKLSPASTRSMLRMKVGQIWTTALLIISANIVAVISLEETKNGFCFLYWACIDPCNINWMSSCAIFDAFEEVFNHSLSPFTNPCSSSWPPGRMQGVYVSSFVCVLFLFRFLSSFCLLCFMFLILKMGNCTY